METNSPKILISCVGENTEKFNFRVLTLFKTLKKFGGNLLKRSRLRISYNQLIPQLRLNYKT